MHSAPKRPPTGAAVPSHHKDYPAWPVLTLERFPVFEIDLKRARSKPRPTKEPLYWSGVGKPIASIFNCSGAVMPARFSSSYSLWPNQAQPALRAGRQRSLRRIGPVKPLRICVLPRRPRGCGSISDPHGANTSDEYLTIGSIAVAHEIARSLVPSTGLSKLPGDPFCGWMRGGPQPQKPTSVMPQKQQTIEKSERNRRHHEQINCSDAVRLDI